MGCMESALSNLFPVDWCDPYGSMPLNKDYSVQIDIMQVETNDGIKVTAVKTPPHAGTTSIQDAISMALGMGCYNDEAQKSSPQSADQGKRDNEKGTGKPVESDTMEPSSSGGSGHRDRNPGSQGSRPGPPDPSGSKSEEEDAKEKAPK